MLYAACCYCLLASDDYATREYATAALVRLVDGWPQCYGPRVSEWAACASHPEVAFRVRRAVAVYTTYRVNSYVPKGVPCWPCCDFYPVPGSFGLDARDRAAWCREDRLLRGDPATGPYWHNYRAGTEREARRLIRDGAAPVEVDRLLQRMWRLELEAGSDCGKREVLESWGTTWRGGYPE